MTQNQITNQINQISGKFDTTWVSTDHPAIKECAQACGARGFERGDIVISCLDGHPDGGDDTKGNYNDPFSGEDMIMTLFVTHRGGACSC